MKVKVFHIRLTKENLLSDQDILNDFLDSIKIIKTSTQLISGLPNYWSVLVFYNEQKVINTDLNLSKHSVTSEIELSVDEERIYEVLKQWRSNKAFEINMPSFIVCHNNELMNVAKLKPKTLEELIKIKGFGEHKIAKFGNEILTILNSIV
ncbi:MAG TPA: HRDC domain-containing protein [Chitinophagales bacterium]|nr:HRDC domain-containing protein [Chitinophagales bacterium]